MRILFSHKFVKRFSKIPLTLQDQFHDRLALFQSNVRSPVLRDHALIGEWIGCRSINITGDFRALYREVAMDTFEFVAIGTHHELFGS